MSTPIWVRAVRERIGSAPLMAVTVNAVVFDDEGRVLLQKRRDDGSWGLPGGILELEESLLEAVKRETKEETGADIEVGALTGLYSQQPVVAYPNGDQVNFVTAVFLCKYVAGELVNQDGEATEVGFFSVESLPQGLHSKFLPRIHDAISYRGLPVVV